MVQGGASKGAAVVTAQRSQARLHPPPVLYQKQWSGQNLTPPTERTHRQGHTQEPGEKPKAFNKPGTRNSFLRSGLAFGEQLPMPLLVTRG